MEVVTGAMGTLLPKLADLVEKEYNLHSKLRDDIISLKKELECMEAVLHEVSEMPLDEPPDNLVKLWARDVRELSYDVEDSIDRFIVCIESSKQKTQCFRGFIDRCLNLLTTANIRHIIGKDIIEIKSRITEVKERHDRYNMVDRAPAKPASRNVDTLRLSARYRPANELIGVEEKSDDLFKMLMEGDEASKQKLKVISIVGFGGLGKTTLANFVYQKVKQHYDCGAFVSISPNPNMTSIFKNLLRQLDKYGNNSELCDEAQLIDKIRELLQFKRYFVVIDDIWDYNVWEVIRYALIENECGSRIITTTRIHDVAKQSGVVYQLGHLSLTDSRKLFYLRIFGTRDKCPNELAELSKNILKKCGGVPLSIITIAGMLANKITTEDTYKYWSKVYQSMGSGLDDNRDVKKVRTVLSTSYYALPQHLKPCFLYLSLYPEDHEFFVEPLILKWLGEGFIRKGHGENIYEVGQDYVDELINRSLIQVLTFTGNKASSFRVHDMVLDLITFLSNEENFLTTLRGQHPNAVPNTVRRLSLQTNEDLKGSESMSLSHVRSLTMLASGLIPSSFLRFPVLRSLDLTRCWQLNDHHFKEICNLVHLRYLRLCSPTITKVPKKIGNLKQLQVLDLHGTRIVELPSSFIQLLQLVYFGADSSLKSIPDGFGNLKSMQDLDFIIYVNSPTTLRLLSGLTKLRRVRFRFNEWNMGYENNLRRCLYSLIMAGYLQIQIKSTVSRVPRWMPSLSSLTILKLRLLTLEEEDLHSLGSIPSLSCLTIRVEKSTQGRENKLVIDNVYPFLCLTKLKIYTTMNVVFAQGAMPKLQTLVLKLKTMGLSNDFDMGLENLSSLVEVIVDFVDYSANPVLAEAAGAAIQDALNRNPNKPKVDFGTTLVLKVEFNDEKRRMSKENLLKAAVVAGVYGISLDEEQRKLTIQYGRAIDAVELVKKLRKICPSIGLISIGPTRYIVDHNNS